MSLNRGSDDKREHSIYIRSKKIIIKKGKEEKNEKERLGLGERKAGEERGKEPCRCTLDRYYRQFMFPKFFT